MAEREDHLKFHPNLGETSLLNKKRENNVSSFLCPKTALGL